MFHPPKNNGAPRPKVSFNISPEDFKNSFDLFVRLFRMLQEGNIWFEVNFGGPYSQKNQPKPNDPWNLQKPSPSFDGIPLPPPTKVVFPQKGENGETVVIYNDAELIDIEERLEHILTQPGLRINQQQYLITDIVSNHPNYDVRILALLIAKQDIENSRDALRTLRNVEINNLKKNLFRTVQEVENRGELIKQLFTRVDLLETQMATFASGENGDGSAPKKTKPSNIKTSVNQGSEGPPPEKPNPKPKGRGRPKKKPDLESDTGA